MTEHARPGLFLTFEGIDGSGKSTQARGLADTLRAAGHDVVATREPGGSPGAEEIRALVLQGAADRWSPLTEVLLFTAARRDHVERTIAPALAAGKIVICDRFADSTRLYQGMVRNAGTAMERGTDPVLCRGGTTDDLRGLVDRLHNLVIGIEPDLTVLIDMDPDTGLSRALSRHTSEERFESFGADLQARMRAGFLDLARAAPDRFVTIDGAHPPEVVAAAVLSAVTPRLPTPRRAHG